MLLDDLAYPALKGRAGTVHLLPLVATEPHGPHAPLSTDTLISVEISCRAADRLRGEIDVLVLPEIAYGVTRYGADFPGALSIGEETPAEEGEQTFEALTEMLAELIREVAAA